MLKVITSGTENSITKGISNLWDIIVDFIIEVYTSIIDALEPIIGEAAAGIFIIGAAFLILILILLKLINR